MKLLEVELVKFTHGVNAHFRFGYANPYGHWIIQHVSIININKGEAKDYFNEAIQAAAEFMMDDTKHDKL